MPEIGPHGPHEARAAGRLVQNGAKALLRLGSNHNGSSPRHVQPAALVDQRVPVVPVNAGVPGT